MPRRSARRKTTVTPGSTSPGRRRRVLKSWHPWLGPRTPAAVTSASITSSHDRRIRIPDSYCKPACEPPSRFLADATALKHRPHISSGGLVDRFAPGDPHDADAGVVVEGLRTRRSEAQTKGAPISTIPGSTALDPDERCKRSGKRSRKVAAAEDTKRHEEHEALFVQEQSS